MEGLEDVLRRCLDDDGNPVAELSAASKVVRRLEMRERPNSAS